MNRLITTIACVVVGITNTSEAEWYTLFGLGTSAKTIEFEGGKSARAHVRKVDLPVTALVLRPDTDRADYFWLEVHLPKTEVIDPDTYFLIIDGRSVGQILYRGPKWAIGFSSLEHARRCFQYLRKFHHLAPDQVRDTTKS